MLRRKRILHRKEHIGTIPHALPIPLNHPMQSLRSMKRKKERDDAYDCCPRCNVPDPCPGAPPSLDRERDGPQYQVGGGPSSRILSCGSMARRQTERLWFTWKPATRQRLLLGVFLSSASAVIRQVSSVSRAQFIWTPRGRFCPQQTTGSFSKRPSRDGLSEKRGRELSQPSARRSEGGTRDGILWAMLVETPHSSRGLPTAHIEHG